MAGTDRVAGARPELVERAAAIGALVALGGALVIVVAGAASDWAGMAVAAAGLATVVVAGWYAVSRRGVRRRIGAAVGVLGAVVFVVGVRMADLSVRRALAVGALGAVSVVAARIALRRTPRALRHEVGSLPPAPPARHPVLIVNPRSGSAAAHGDEIVDGCRARGIEVVHLGPGDDLLQLAEDAIERGADVIGMAGGDGSQAVVAFAAMRHDVAHVVVPAGTRNHFALDLGLDRKDVVGALDAYVDGIERRVDLARVNGRLFVNNASLGVYAQAVQSQRYREAKSRTVADQMPEVFGPGGVRPDLRFTGPDGTEHTTADVLMVSNNPYQLRFAGGRGTREHLDDGLLGIVALHVEDAADAARFVALQAAGRADRFPGWVEWEARELRVDSGAAIAIALDGEAMVLEPPLEFEILPSALRVRIPRHALGRSPAALATHVLSQSTIVVLARVAAGRPDALR